MDVYIFVCSNWNWILIKKKKKGNSKLSTPSLMVPRNVNSTLQTGHCLSGGATHHIPALQTLPAAPRHHTALCSCKSAIACLNLGSSSPVRGSEWSWCALHPWPCTLPSLWHMPEFPRTRGTLLQGREWNELRQSSAECLHCCSRREEPAAGEEEGGQGKISRSRQQWWDSSHQRGGTAAALGGTSNLSQLLPELSLPWSVCFVWTGLNPLF